MISEALPSNVRRVISAAEELARSVTGIVAIALVGSWAHGRGRADSDVDLIVLTNIPAVLLEDPGWIRLFDPRAALIGAREFGAIQERRLRLPDGLEVEIGIGHPDWAATDPVDEGTQTVARDGLIALFDPERLLASLLAAVASLGTFSSADAAEVVLADAGVTRVVKVGATVRRPVRPFTATVQQFLAHLRQQGVDFVPEPLGYDDCGREVLSYLEGEVPAEPLPEWATTEQALAHLARMIRRLHDAAESWQPPPDAVWGAIPGSADVATEPLFDTPELVSHRDFCPGNVVFQDGVPAGLIDFDLAQPTTRVVDLVNALYWWAPLTHPDDRPPYLRSADIPARVRVFADAYGMTDEQRAQVASVAVRRARNAHRTIRHAATVDPVFRRWWDEGLRDRVPRDEAWIAENADSIAAAL